MYLQRFLRLHIFLSMLLILGSAFIYYASVIQADAPQKTFTAPPFTHSGVDDWINSEPLTINDLKGKVTLLDFWTFECWNCYRSFPWLRSVEKKYREEPFQVIGVHTPEFDNERVYANVVEKVKEFKLHHPIMIDNDYSYWRAMHNRYWPAFYLIDKRGVVRAIYVGETHKGDRRARAIEKQIDTLLAEN